MADTPQEIPFLSILQHLLRIDPKEPVSDIVWDTAETLVHRATLLESREDAAKLLRAPSVQVPALTMSLLLYYRSPILTHSFVTRISNSYIESLEVQFWLSFNIPLLCNTGEGWMHMSAQGSLKRWPETKSATSIVATTASASFRDPRRYALIAP